MKQFNDRFPTSDACLEELKQLRFADFACPNCDSSKLYKVKGRSMYASPCGFQVAPLSGTIFHKSSTDLRTWFLTIFLMTTTRSGVSAKTVERMTGVTYKTAWRMCNQIRTLMQDGGDLLTGVVEVDETYFQANPRKDSRLPKGKRTGEAGIVLGMAEVGGRVRVRRVPNSGLGMLDHVYENVSKSAIIHTDGWLAYKKLPKMGYTHAVVDHSIGQHVVDGVGTQNIDGFWNNLKRGVYGVYRHCEPKYLESYANEYAWRYSNCNSGVPMFELLLSKVA